LTLPTNFPTTLIGSVPYTNTIKTCKLANKVLDIPIWPQMGKLGFLENMYTQFGAALPSIKIDGENERIFFSTDRDISADLESFYNPYIEENLEYFCLPPEHASGFYSMLELLSATPGEWIKGQVTGPISMGLTVTDQDLRASLYNDVLADVLVKNAAMHARWQIHKLKEVRRNIIVFIDEPYMASFGSAYISLSREQAVGMLDEVFDSIHTEGGIAGVHCCANTDWSVLLATKVDILNLDAYGYLDNLALYPAELRQFLDRGGLVAWGLVPTNEDIFSTSPQKLVEKFILGLELICSKAAARGVTISTDVLSSRSMITPACGLGSTTPEIADEVLAILTKTSHLLRS